MSTEESIQSYMLMCADENSAELKRVLLQTIARCSSNVDMAVTSLELFIKYDESNKKEDLLSLVKYMSSSKSSLDFNITEALYGNISIDEHAVHLGVDLGGSTVRNLYNNQRLSFLVDQALLKHECSEMSSHLFELIVGRLGNISSAFNGQICTFDHSDIDRITEEYKDQLMEMNYMVTPVNLGSHWTLAVDSSDICNLHSSYDEATVVRYIDYCKTNLNGQNTQATKTEEMMATQQVTQVQPQLTQVQPQVTQVQPQLTQVQPQMTQVQPQVTQEQPQVLSSQISILGLPQQMPEELKVSAAMSGKATKKSDKRPVPVKPEGAVDHDIDVNGWMDNISATKEASYRCWRMKEDKHPEQIIPVQVVTSVKAGRLIRGVSNDKDEEELQEELLKKNTKPEKAPKTEDVSHTIVEGILSGTKDVFLLSDGWIGVVRKTNATFANEVNIMASAYASIGMPYPSYKLYWMDKTPIVEKNDEVPKLGFSKFKCFMIAYHLPNARVSDNKEFIDKHSCDDDFSKIIYLTLYTRMIKWALCMKTNSGHIVESNEACYSIGEDYDAARSGLLDGWISSTTPKAAPICMFKYKSNLADTFNKVSANLDKMISDNAFVYGQARSMGMNTRMRNMTGFLEIEMSSNIITRHLTTK